MASSTNTYQPDYTVPPGWVLADMLEARRISHAEFARRCGRSPKLVSEIIAAKAPVEPGTALQFERVLGMDASVWLNIEANYRLHRARKMEEHSLRQSAAWASRFPINELVKLGAITKPTDNADAARQLLRFFGVGTPRAWHHRYDELAMTHSHPTSFKSSKEAVAGWLRLGELAADKQDCSQFIKGTFVQALRDVRQLTDSKPEQFLPDIRQLCNDAGVAFVLVPCLTKTELTGAARWLTPNKALIQLSLSHRWNDRFWLTFFHQAAHILLHSKKAIYVDDGSQNSDELEKQASDWAADFLIPRQIFQKWVRAGAPSKSSIRDLARDLEIAPGIIVGVLQQKGKIDPRHYADLKERYDLVTRNRYGEGMAQES